MTPPSTTLQKSPTSHLRLGIARADITPPVGIYHPMWGAARHQRATGVQRFEGSVCTIVIPQRERPTLAQLEESLQGLLTLQAEADRNGETLAARDYGARAERARRSIGRLHNLPPGDTYPYTYTVRRFGDAIWVSVGGEPYNAIQTDLRAAFPDQPMIVSALAGELAITYLLRADCYGKGLYQEEPSVLAPGCLEQVTAAVIETIHELG